MHIYIFIHTYVYTQTHLQNMHTQTHTDMKSLHLTFLQIFLWQENQYTPWGLTEADSRPHLLTQTLATSPSGKIPRKKRQGCVKSVLLVMHSRSQLSLLMIICIHTEICSTKEFTLRRNSSLVIHTTVPQSVFIIYYTSALGLFKAQHVIQSFYEYIKVESSSIVKDTGS